MPPKAAANKDDQDWLKQVGKTIVCPGRESYCLKCKKKTKQKDNKFKVAKAQRKNASKTVTPRLMGECSVCESKTSVLTSSDFMNQCK